MTTTVIGATGRIGSAVVQRLLDAGQTVRVLVRDPGQAGKLFGAAPALEVVHTQLDDPAAVTAGLAKSGTAFLAMGSIGIEANLQRVAIQAAASTPDLRQLVRLSVLNAGPGSLGINQRGHWSIDVAAQAGQPAVHHDPARHLLGVPAGRGTGDQGHPDLDRSGRHRAGRPQRPPRRGRRRRPHPRRPLDLGPAP